MVNEWQKKTDDELVDEAQTGLRGQGAAVEMTRRLRDSLVKQLKATNRLTKWIRVLTFSLLVITAVIAWLTAVVAWKAVW